MQPGSWQTYLSARRGKKDKEFQWTQKEAENLTKFGSSYRQKHGWLRSFCVADLNIHICAYDTIPYVHKPTVVFCWWPGLRKLDYWVLRVHPRFVLPVINGCTLFRGTGRNALLVWINVQIKKYRHNPTNRQSLIVVTIFWLKDRMDSES